VLPAPAADADGASTAAPANVELATTTSKRARRTELLEAQNGKSESSTLT
jgi:hypothetical protein